jgi:hypothetical protein
MRHRLPTVVLAALLASPCGCGSSGTTSVSPTSTSDPLPPAGLRPGPNRLSLAGFAAVGEGNGPLRTTCTPGAGPTGGMQHWSYGQVRADGDGWIFEGGQPTGAITFRLRVAAAQGSGAQVTGMMWGQSLDAGWAPIFAPTGVRVEADGATFQGQVAAGPGVTGRLTGTIVFVGADGSRATCSEVSVQMAPGVP